MGLKSDRQCRLAVAVRRDLKGRVSIGTGAGLASTSSHSLPMSVVADRSHLPGRFRRESTTGPAVLIDYRRARWFLLRRPQLNGEGRAACDSLQISGF